MNELTQDAELQKSQNDVKSKTKVILFLCFPIALVVVLISLPFGNDWLVQHRLHNELKGIREIHVRDRFVTLGGNDEQVIFAAKVLARYKHITSLVVYGHDTTDVALNSISQMTSLDTLYIRDAHISDDGLRVLCNLQALTSLSLTGCQQITDRGILQISCLKKLRALDVGGTKATEACLEPLIKANPTLKNSVLGLSSQPSPTRD